MSWGEFLSEKLYTGGFNRLKNWKEDGSIIVWIHTKTAIRKRLLHVIGYVATGKDDKGKETREIKFFFFTCHEDPRDFVNKVPPKHCPLCRFIEWLQNNGDIEDTETVWQAEIGDKKRDKVCSKADFVGDRDAGGDWSLSFKPKLEYVMAVINDAEPEEGIVVSAEKYSLGEAIKKAVHQEIDRKGPEDGDPNISPYAIKWVFDPKARKPTDYYTAYRYERAKLTDEIQELLDKPAEDLSSWVAPGDTNFLRKIMEAHVVCDVDLDDFFDNVREGQAPPPQDSKPKEAPEEKPKSSGKKKAKRVAKTEKEPEPEKRSDVPDNAVECPTCRGTGEKKNGNTCKVCEGTGLVEGPEEDDEPEPEKEEPPKKKRTRSVKEEPPPPPPDEEEYEDYCGNCDKPVPDDVDSCPHCGVPFD